MRIAGRIGECAASGAGVRAIARRLAAIMSVAVVPVLAPHTTAADSSVSQLSYLLDGHFALGGGVTYQYDGSKGTTLGLAAWSTLDDHYEWAAFRFLTPQTRRGCDLAEPNWVFEASRRWTMRWSPIESSGVEPFFGVGAAYKNKTDDLNGSNWNFAEQLGWRTPKQPSGHRLEFAIRHISNAGIKKPNPGEDFRA